MKVVVIGSGNVASHFALGFHTIGVKVAQIWSKQLANAAELAQQVGAQPIDSLTQLITDADLYLLAVKDDAVSALVAELPGLNGVIAHTAGAVAIDVFSNKFENYGVFYPLQTLSKSRALSFQAIPLCVEGNNEKSLQFLIELGRLLGAPVTEVDSDKRKVLHLSAAFACNFANHMYALAEEILNEQGLDFEIIRPLIKETAAKIVGASPKMVQTGPAIRKDSATLNKHEAMLTEHPQALAIYKMVSESIKKIR